MGRWGSAGRSCVGFAETESFADGWNIGKPDVVLQMTDEFKVTASGSDEYIYFAIPTNFTEDKYMRAIEVRPGNRRAVHHVVAFIQKGGVGAPARGSANNNRVVGSDLF